MTREYTDAQRDAIEITGCHLCVDAGAGSGKTMVLIERMLRLLETRNATLDQIVAITFTERAAGEMKERLRREAHKRAPRDDAEKLSFWRDIERRADTARISTIHSFCMAVLKNHALALGQDPDFAILSDAEGYVLRHEVAEAALHDALENQDEAVVRLAVEFGATMLVDELARMLKDRARLDRAIAAAPHDDPAALLRHWRAIAETDCMQRLHAARPEIERVRHELDSLDGCCTKPGDKRETLRRDLLSIAADLLIAANLADAADAYQRLMKVSAVGGSAKAWPSQDAFESIKDARDALREALGFMANGECDPRVEERSAQLTCDAVAVYRSSAQTYRSEKRRRAAMEFDDLILDTLAIVRGREDIRKHIAADIKYLLIDEFQDTDSIQFELAQRLAEESPGPELFFVGDAKQSIYYFRGAEVRVFNGARQIANRTIELKRNFRTLPDVLWFVNDFFAQSGLLRQVEESYQPMDAHRAATHEVCVELIMPPDGDVKALAKESKQLEAAFLAARIRALCEGPDAIRIEDPSNGEMRHARYGDVAILFRATNDLYVYEQALQAAGIPYYVVAGSGFYRRQEIIDLLNLLHVVIDPFDTYAQFGFLRSPVAGISDETLLALEWNGGFAKAFEQDGYEGPQPEAFCTAQQLIAGLRADSDLPLPVFLRRVLERTAFEAILLGQYLGLQKAANIRKMVDLAHQFGQTRASGLRAFIRYVDEMADVELPEGEASMLPEGGDAVILMTIHKSKGLEFPIVVVPDLGREAGKGRGVLTAVHPDMGVSLRPYNDEGKVASTPFHALIQAEHQRKEEAEHARILYVALTRARDRLILSSGPDRCAKGSWMESLIHTLRPQVKHGEAIAAASGKWQCRVWHEFARSYGLPLEHAVAPGIDEQAIMRRVAPMSHVPAARRVFGVTEVLDWMAPHPVESSQHAAPRGNAVAMARGSAVHALFEQWDFVEDPLSLVTQVVYHSDVPAHARPAMLDDLVRISQRVFDSPLRQECAATTRDMRERPFVLRVGDALLRGELDAILPGARILDYKTGARRPDLGERYLWQLRLYAAAVEALDGAVADEAFLFYVDSGEIVSVDVSPKWRADALARAADAIQRLQRGGAPAVLADVNDA